MQISISHATAMQVTQSTLRDILERKVFEDEGSYGLGFEIDKHGDIYVYNHFLPEEEPTKLRKATDDEIVLWDSLTVLRKESDVLSSKKAA